MSSATLLGSATCFVFKGEKDMAEIKSKDKIIQTQQSVIYDLENKIRQLEAENEELKIQLKVERDKPKEGYKKAKELQIMLENKIAEYQQLVDDFKEQRILYKQNFDKKLQEIEDIKEKYKKKLQETVKSTKREIKLGQKLGSKKK